MAQQSQYTELVKCAAGLKSQLLMLDVQIVRLSLVEFRKTTQATNTVHVMAALEEQLSSELIKKPVNIRQVESLIDSIRYQLGLEG
jgi:hypothetical protein